MLEHLPVLLDLLGVPVLELTEGLGVLLLGLEEVLVPLLVELLVLLDVGLLTLLSLLRLVEDELLVTAVVVLKLELGDSVLGHLGLDVLLLGFASPSVVLENPDEILDVIGSRLLIESLVHFFLLH